MFFKKWWMVIFCSVSAVFLGRWGLGNSAQVAAGPPPPVIGEPASGASEGVVPAFTGCTAEDAPVVNPDYEQQIVDLVNQERATNGLPPLKRVDPLDRAARYHATDMGVDDYDFNDSISDHNTQDRVDGALQIVCGPGERISQFYTWNAWAENIAAGFATPQAVMDAWMNSSGHRANILRDIVWEIGVGYYEDGDLYSPYWVQDFGRRPDRYPLIINQEAAQTDSAAVSLYIYGTWDEMRLRNDGGLWGPWQSFSNSLNWTLNGNAGVRTVEAELRQGTITTTSQDTIELICWDLAAMAAEWRSDSTQPGWDQIQPYDIDKNNHINIVDFMLVASTFDLCSG